MKYLKIKAMVESTIRNDRARQLRLAATVIRDHDRSIAEHLADGISVVGDLARGHYLLIQIPSMPVLPKADTHALALLQAEDDRLTAEITERTQQGKPAGWRDSEFAMTMASLKQRRAQIFEALQILNKVGKE